MGKKEIIRKRRLKTMEDVRRFLADTVNRLNKDDIAPDKASKLGYLCQILARIIEGGDIVKRIEKLEEAERQRNELFVKKSK